MPNTDNPAERAMNIIRFTASHPSASNQMSAYDHLRLGGSDTPTQDLGTLAGCYMERFGCDWPTARLACTTGHASDVVVLAINDTGAPTLRNAIERAMRRLPLKRLPAKEDAQQ